MLCPNCNQQLSEINYDKQLILNCPNCRSSFFDENSINRISLDTAKKLAGDHKNFFISGNEKLCPKDRSPLSVIRDDELIPPNVTLLRCPACRGVFTYPDDLVLFKSAQGIKIDFFKIWGKPLSSLRSVLVIGFMAIIFTSLIASLNSLNKPQFSQTKAEDMIKNIKFYKNTGSIIVNFNTTIMLRAEMVIINQKTGISTKRTISDKSTTTHYALLTDIVPNEDLYYKIILFDKHGGRIETKEMKLQE